MNLANTIDASPDADPGRLLHVSRVQFGASLAASITIFLFAVGPMWRHAGDIGRLDGAILWSYCAIPPLIAGCLIASRRWSLRGFLLDTLALTLVKYVATSLVAIALWATVAPPQRAAASSTPRPAAPQAEQALPATAIDPARTGAVRVTVVDAEGSPVAGALAYVASGLEGYVFAPPGAPVELAHGPDGVTPALAVAEVGQRLEGRSADGRMHTLVASADGAALFNVPLLASGTASVTHLREAHGMTTVRCNVHPWEPASRLLTLTHPFSGRGDAGGQVTLSGVPAGRVRLGAADGPRDAGEAKVEIVAGATAEARLTLRR
jgi:plastocyanin